MSAPKNTAEYLANYISEFEVDLRKQEGYSNPNPALDGFKLIGIQDAKMHTVPVELHFGGYVKTKVEIHDGQLVGATSNKRDYESEVNELEFKCRYDLPEKIMPEFVKKVKRAPYGSMTEPVIIYTAPKTEKYTYPCPTCTGKGRTPCTTCGGRGYRICGCFDGMMSCPQCSWMTRMNCNCCQRTGKVYCLSCGGDGRLRCWVCSNTGLSATTCPTCKGVPHHTEVTAAKLQLIPNFSGPMPKSVPQYVIGALKQVGYANLEQHGWVELQKATHFLSNANFVYAVTIPFFKVEIESKAAGRSQFVIFGTEYMVYEGKFGF